MLTLLLIVVPGLAHALSETPVLAAELYYQGFAENTDEILALAFDGNDDRSPQSVIIGAGGACYLAEQRKGRILRTYGY